MWKKRAALLLLICLTAVLLCGCAREQTTYPDAGTAPTRQPVRQADVLQSATDVPAPTQAVVVSFPEDDEPDLTDDEYGPDEEAEETPADMNDFTAYVSANGKYAGSTPIPLDPVDMPTPTPRPDLEFEYETYDMRLGYSMEVPVGWTVEQDDTTAFVIRDPEMRDNVNASFSLTAQSVSSSYRLNDLKTELSNQLSQIQRNYVGWRIWTADSRPLLKADGFFNAYRGVTYDDTIVRGLVHVALVDNRVLTLSFSAPGYYNTSYQRVYNQMRNTIK